MTTSSAPQCLQCGHPIPSDAPAGLCPRCVLAAAATPLPAAVDARAHHLAPSRERVQAAFPHLEILERIGAGGMGVVFKARQKHLDRLVALKLLPETLAQDPRFAERFNREARVLARLNHPHIVTVHDFGQSGAFCFLLMEFVDGVNLREAMRAGRFSPAAALGVVPGICEALQFAHDQGVLHRDIKPENILLDARGRVKIADFGIAKLLDVSTRDITLTASGAALGTPQYMAPEQIERPDAIDHRADIYSLGVVFYELLTGELPIGRFAAPSEKVALDARIDEIVLRALAKEREQRQQSAAQIGTEIEGLRTTPPPPPPAAISPNAGTRSGTAGAGRPSLSAPTSTGTPDFLLCHPSLPRMAQAITLYTLVVAPALGLLSLLTLAPDPVHGAYAQFVNQLLRGLTFVGTLLVLLVQMTGGWKLRALKPAGPRWIGIGIAMNLMLGVALLLGQLWQETLSARWDPSPSSEVTPLPAWEGILGVAALGAVVFEICALIWLIRHRRALASLLSAATPGPAR